MSQCSRLAPTRTSAPRGCADDPAAPTGGGGLMLNLDEVQARADAAHKEVSEIALHGANRWRMSIPAEPSRDSDLIIAGSLQDVPALIRALREAYAEIERLRQEAGLVAELRTAREVVSAGWAVDRKEPGCYARLYKALTAYDKL